MTRKGEALGLALAVGVGAASQGQELRIPSNIVTRADTLDAALVLAESTQGPGTVRLTWTDSYGRTVAEETRSVEAEGGRVPLKVPLARVVAMLNFLEAEWTAGGKTVKPPKAEFIVTPSGEWDDYKVVMYFAYPRPEQQRALRNVGVNAGQIQSGRTQQRDGARQWWQDNYPFYCDQVGSHFYAAYHTPSQKPKNKQLIEAREMLAQDRTKKEPFFRKPCFHDPAARAEAVARYRKAAECQMRFKPLLYGTDEAGVADLVAPWDFCFDPRTLDAMRKWLLQEYGSLEGINREWGTAFTRIEDVTPMTTDEVLTGSNANLSAWADHLLFMNKTFADAVKEATDAVHAVDPAGRAGLLGCQMPAAFGGYDYWLLAQAMDAIEPYNIGNNREVWRSFAPRKPAVTTGFGAGDQEVWRLWYQALHGDLGVVIYDEKQSYLDDKANPKPLALQIGPTYRELTGGLVKQLAAMERVNDPIAIHYSQPSITAFWVFEHHNLGLNWVKNGSSYERIHSDFLRLRQAMIYLLEDNDLQYRFVSYAELANGAFDRMYTKVMFLPQSIAMSPAECDALRRFVERGGTLVADCRTALMDAHCKPLAKGQLDDLFGIERTDLKFEPGPAGLKPVAGDTAGATNAGAELANVCAAEPGVKAAADAKARYQDSRGVPAMIVRNVGKGRTVYLNMIVTDYHRWRQKPPEGDALREVVRQWLQDWQVAPLYAVTLADGRPAPGVEVHRFRSGDMEIVGLHRNYGLRVSELGPPDYQSQAALEAPMEVKIAGKADSAFYDVRAGRALGMQRSVTAVLPKFEPLVFAVFPKPPGDLTVQAPKEAKRGDLVDVRIRIAGADANAAHAFRCEVIGPNGAALDMLTRNLCAPKGEAAWSVPIAMTDPAGEYTLSVRHVATGTKGECRLQVR